MLIYSSMRIISELNSKNKLFVLYYLLKIATKIIILQHKYTIFYFNNTTLICIMQLYILIIDTKQKTYSYKTKNIHRIHRKF